VHLSIVVNSQSTIEVYHSLLVQNVQTCWLVWPPRFVQSGQTTQIMPAFSAIELLMQPSVIGYAFDLP
jgi:hypothetical protein